MRSFSPSDEELASQGEDLGQLPPRELLKRYFAAQEQPPAGATAPLPVDPAAPSPSAEEIPKGFEGIPSPEESAADLQKKRLIGGLGEAADQIGYSIAGGTAKSDPTFYRGISKQGEEDSKNALDNRKLLNDYFEKKQKDKESAEQKDLDRKNKLEQSHIISDRWGDRQDNSLSFRDEQFAKRQHGKVMDRLDRDQTLRDQMRQLRNLDNSAVLTEKTDVITPQQFNDFQQAVIQNLGLKGSTSVGEREERYFNSVGMNGKKVVQFLTGTPQNISRNDPLYKHVKALATFESDNVKNQVKSQIDGITSGNGYIYDENPRLQADLDKKIAALMGKTKLRGLQSGEPGNDSGVSTPAAQPAPQQQLSKTQRNKATGETRTVFSDDGGQTWHP